MGIVRETYFGPYVECRFQQKTVLSPRWHCSNTACRRHSDQDRVRSGKFCQECGEPIKKFKVQKQIDAVCLWDLEMEIELSLSPFFLDLPSQLAAQRLHIWVGDLGLPEDGLPSRFSYVDENEQALRRDTAERHRNRNSSIHKAPRQGVGPVAQIYGEENVVVRWGVMNYIRC